MGQAHRLLVLLASDHSEGIKPLRDKWQELIQAKNPSLGKAGVSLPVVTCGVTNGLSMVRYMFTGERDKIIVASLTPGFSQAKIPAWWTGRVMVLEG